MKTCFTPRCSSDSPAHLHLHCHLHPRTSVSSTPFALPLCAPSAPKATRSGRLPGQPTAEAPERTAWLRYSLLSPHRRNPLTEEISVHRNTLLLLSLLESLHGNINSDSNNQPQQTRVKSEDTKKPSHQTMAKKEEQLCAITIWPYNNDDLCTTPTTND